MQNKMKVVWICHFSNAEIQALIPLWKKRNEMASWIPNILKGFENREDIEMHVISPHVNLKRTTVLKIRSIKYYFISYGTPFRHKTWPMYIRFDVFSNFYCFRRKVRKIINEVHPDLINLIGAENAYYSSAVFDYKNKYPVLITIQGFISQIKEEVFLYPYLKKQILVEEKILKSFKYFCGEQDSSNYISTFNHDHIFYRMYYPVNEVLISEIKDIGKKYDCIYFGAISKIKGAEDFIKVIALIKTRKPNVKACIAGSGDISTFLNLANELNCAENIEFIGFVKTQNELFEYVKASKVFLAPPYFERLSSTIREAMFLNIPVVAYATGGIPYINQYDEHILMVETGDYKAMAKKTLFLLLDDEKRKKLAEKAYKYAQNEFSLAVNIQRHIDAYKNILKNKIEQIQ